MKRFAVILLMLLNLGYINSQILSNMIDLKDNINHNVDMIDKLLTPIDDRFNSDYLITLLAHEKDSLLYGCAIGDFKKEPKFIQFKIDGELMTTIDVKVKKSEIENFYNKYITKLAGMSGYTDSLLPGIYVYIKPNNLKRFSYITYCDKNSSSPIYGKIRFIRYGTSYNGERVNNGDWLDKLFEFCFFSSLIFAE
ncbi:MAG: hypothetical protein ACI30O_07435 [Muribaculaceae bacterium]